LQRRTITAIIPARLDSTRLPNKVILDINGKPMIQHVYESVKRIKGIDQVIVATDSQEVLDIVIGFKGYGVITSADHICGTDRIAEVSKLVESDLILNVQADEPLIKPKHLLPLIELAQGEDFKIGTTITSIDTLQEYRDQNVVKVVTQLEGKCLYFSRGDIPYNRSNARDFSLAKRHIGIYCFAKDVLEEIVALPPSPLEECEKLEQLRWLQHGFPIQSVEIDGDLISVDTEDDLAAVRKLI